MTTSGASAVGDLPKLPDDVLWPEGLDAVERRWIEELGGMNIMFVFNDGSIVTPVELHGMKPRMRAVNITATEALAPRKCRCTLVQRRRRREDGWGGAAAGPAKLSHHYPTTVRRDHR